MAKARDNKSHELIEVLFVICLALPKVLHPRCKGYMPRMQGSVWHIVNTCKDLLFNECVCPYVTKLALLSDSLNNIQIAALKNIKGLALSYLDYKLWQERTQM